MISVILPIYERVDAVLCCLAALENQTLDSRAFEILVVDDSESDTVRDAIWPPRDRRFWYIRSSPPRVGRFTAGRARNIGVANAQGDLMVFIDQDVLLAPDCLENYQRAYEHYGDNVVYVGLYHWMRRLDFGPADVTAETFRALMEAGLDLVIDPMYEFLLMDEPGLQGIDHRVNDFGEFDRLVDDAALGAHSGNIGYPRKLFLELGGFDEAINRHGGEDADLGLTAKEHGAKFLLWDAIWGLHRWHTRDQLQNVEDVQHNIQYIDKKHGIGPYAEAKKFAAMDARDWSNEQHYHKAVGGVPMQVAGEPTIWICRDGHRLGVPTPEAFARLGFKSENPLLITSAALEQYVIEGTADA